MCVEQIKLRDDVVYRQAKGYFTVRDLCAVLSDYQNSNDDAGVGEKQESEARMSKRAHSYKARVCFKELVCKGFVDSDATSGDGGNSSGGGEKRVPTFLSYWVA